MRGAKDKAPGFSRAAQLLAQAQGEVVLTHRRLAGKRNASRGAQPRVCGWRSALRLVDLNVLTEGVSPDSFTVEYKQNGVYSATPPAQPGTYDVKITRPMDFKSGQLSDPDHLPFEKEITDGLVITKYSQSAPTGVAAVAENIRYRNDGRLTGVTADMEYRAEAASGYTAVTGTEVAGLAPGTYFVRYKETAPHFASGDVQLTVASGRAAYDTDSTQRAKTITRTTCGRRTRRCCVRP